MEAGKPYCLRKLSQFMGREGKDVKKNLWLCFLYLFLLLKIYTDEIYVSSLVLNSEGIG